MLHIIGDRDFPVPRCCCPRRAGSSSPLRPSKVGPLETTAPTLAVPVTASVSLQFPGCLAPTGLYEGVTIMPADILTSMWLLGVYGEGGGRTLALSLSCRDLYKSFKSLKKCLVMNASLRNGRKCWHGRAGTMEAWLDSWNTTASAVTPGDSCMRSYGFKQSLSSALNTTVIDRYLIIFNDDYASLFSILWS